VNPLVSVVVTAYNVGPWLDACLASLAAQTLADFEVLCVDDGSTDASGAIIREYAATDPRFRHIRQPNRGAAAARNAGLSRARGVYVFFADGDDVFAPRLLEASTARAEATGADIVAFEYTDFADGDEPGSGRFALGLDPALLPYPADAFDPRDAARELFVAIEPNVWTKLYRRDFLLKNGLVFGPYRRSEDVPHSYTALAAASLIAPLAEPLTHYRLRPTSKSNATRSNPLGFFSAFAGLRRDLEARGLLEPFRVSYCTRLADNLGWEVSRLPAHTRPRAAVEHFLATEGLGALGLVDLTRNDFATERAWMRYRELAALDAGSVGTAPAGTVPHRPTWALLNPAGGRVPERWGDTAFAGSLARRLWCQGVATDHFFHAHWAEGCGADVRLVLRGDERAALDGAGVNALWILYGIESVTPEELAGYHLVYAASEPWAAAMTASTGTTVRPLLQCTDTAVFHLPPPGAARDLGVIFVGHGKNQHLKGRQVVFDALAGGLRPRVWGPLWWGLIPDDLRQAEYVPNAQLGDLYRRARIVLNDHRPDMAANGFISNRLFDAVACGTRVVSDAIEGLEDLFHGAVQVYQSPEHLAWLCSEEGLREAFPSDAEMDEIAREVAERHSFEARAARLLADVAAYGRPGA
jgi:glycosyltransferase involved in cell wall biosynthesis